MWVRGRKHVGEYVNKRSADAVASGSALWPAESVVAEGQFARVVDEQQRAVEGRLALASLDFRAELLANELRAREKLNRSVRRVAVPRDDDALSTRTASNDNRVELLRRRAADLLRERVDEVNSEQQRIWHDVEKEVAHLVAEMRTFHLDSLVSPINLRVNKHMYIDYRSERRKAWFPSDCCRQQRFRQHCWLQQCWQQQRWLKHFHLLFRVTRNTMEMRGSRRSFVTRTYGFRFAKYLAI